MLVKGAIGDSLLHSLLNDVPPSGYVFSAIDIHIRNDLSDVKTSAEMKDIEVSPADFV